MRMMTGSFRDRTLEEDMNRANISEQITVRQGPEARSHTAGFEVCRYRQMMRCTNAKASAASRH